MAHSPRFERVHSRVNALGFQTITVNIPGWAGRTSPAARSRVVCRASRLELLGIRFDGWWGETTVFFLCGY